MAQAKFKLETFTTPVGIARMAFLNKPSTKFNADGVYSVKLVFEPGEVSGLITKAEKMIEDKVAEVIKEDPKVKKIIKTAKVYQPDLDDEGDETGKIILNFKRNAKTKLKDGSIKVNKVKLIDAEGNLVTDEIWSGSKLAARFFMSAYYIPKDKEVGISLKLTHVLVVDLVNGGAGDGPENTERLGFGKIEGSYSAAKKPTAGSEGDDAGDDAGDDDSADF